MADTYTPISYTDFATDPGIILTDMLRYFNSAVRSCFEKAKGVKTLLYLSRHYALGNELLICTKTITELISTTETKKRQFDKSVVTDGTVSYRNDNLKCHKWRKSC